MITWKVNGKKIECPSCYEELTTGGYQRALFWDDDKPDVADRDFFKLFSILTETDYAGITQTPENEVSIWNAVGWYVTQPFRFSTELPKALEINRKIVDVPKGVGHISIGQNIHLRRLIEKSKYVEENISMAVAIALQPEYDGKPFDIDRAKQLEKIVLDMPICLTYPVGFFFASECGKAWAEVYKNLAPNPKQPNAEFRKNVAELAEVWRLRAFDDLDLIERYAEKFGQDPDEVYAKTRFDTLIAFCVKWKESDEYRERYQHMYSELTKPDK